jgi:hypothetical protein
MDHEIEVWNRACDPDREQGMAEGDRALRDALFADGMINNGGMAHCLEVLGPARVAAASGGYRTLGRPDIAELFDRASELAGGAIPTDEEERQDYFLELAHQTHEQIEVLGDRYLDLATSESLDAMLSEQMALWPHRFAPVEGGDRY